MESEKKASLRLELIEKMTTLATAGLGFVAGLAWNDAIQSFFTAFIPAQGSLVAKFIYAILLTVGIVILTTWLSRSANAIKERLNK